VDSVRPPKKSVLVEAMLDDCANRRTVSLQRSRADIQAERMKTGTTTSEARQGLSCSDLLSALKYVANESQRNPMESVRDMCNEAFDRYGIPMTAQWSGSDDYPIKFISDNAKADSSAVAD